MLIWSKAFYLFKNEKKKPPPEIPLAVGNFK